MTVLPTAQLVTVSLLSLVLATMPGAALAQNSSVSTGTATAPLRADDAPKAEAPTTAQAPAGAVGGMGDINLYPKRVVIDDRNRTASVGIYNKTANTGDYEITVGDMLMTPQGQIVDPTSVKPDDPGLARLKGAAQIVRFSPHRFTLPGNEAQMVRLMARVSPDLPAGEYRTHFSVIAVPPGDDGLTIDEAAKGKTAPTGIGVRITPRFGISIPVIVRVGDTALTTGLTDLAVQTTANGQRLIRVTITRSGTRSAFGDITVTAAGSAKPVAIIRGVGVYPEVDSRTVLIPVDPAVEARLLASGAKLSVSFVDDDFAPGKTLARQDFIVP